MQAPEVLGGRYELRGVLGRGGMAEVRDGWDIRLDRPVAIKLLYPVFTSQPDNRMRFEVEARAAAALNHPHIVSVHDSGEHAGMPYIVMERLSEQTLADVIARGPLPQPQVRSILAEVLSALAAAHAAGILHRDIKPANILFSPSGHAKVADFGIAKSAASAHTDTQNDMRLRITKFLAINEKRQVHATNVMRAGRLCWRRAGRCRAGQWGIMDAWTKGGCCVSGNRWGVHDDGGRG